MTLADKVSELLNRKLLTKRFAHLNKEIIELYGDLLFWNVMQKVVSNYDESLSNFNFYKELNLIKEETKEIRQKMFHDWMGEISTSVIMPRKYKVTKNLGFKYPKLSDMKFVKEELDLIKKG